METIRVHAKHGEGGPETHYAIINRSDFDKAKHKPFDDEAREQLRNDPQLTEAEQKLLDEDLAQRKVNAMRGQTNTGFAVDATGKNPSGTFSEPTPTDVRFPDKDATEFENNRGAFRGASAAEIRAAEGMPDKPGGINPAEAARAAKVTGAKVPGLSDQVEIPEDWQGMSAAERKALAQDLGADADVTAKQANEHIEAEVERRAAAKAK